MTRWIHGISRDLLRAAFGDYFGVATEHADILILLYERPGERITTRKMRVLLNTHRPLKRQTVYERVRVLREIMEPESLDSGGQLDDLGYELTSIGVRECDQALRAMAQILWRDTSAPGEAMPTIGTEERKALPAPESFPLRTPLKAAS